MHNLGVPATMTFFLIGIPKYKIQQRIFHFLHSQNAHVNSHPVSLHGMEQKVQTLSRVFNLLRPHRGRRNPNPNPILLTPCHRLEKRPGKLIM
jgi:hypothetical protein